MMPSHRRIANPMAPRKALALAVGMDMGKEMVAYLEVMYPDVFERMNSGCRLSIRNHICNDFMAAMEIVGAENHLDRLKERAAFRRKWLAMHRARRKGGMTEEKAIRLIGAFDARAEGKAQS